MSRENRTEATRGTRRFFGESGIRVDFTAAAPVGGLHDGDRGSGTAQSRGREAGAGPDRVADSRMTFFGCRRNAGAAIGIGGAVARSARSWRSGIET
jgi:hypothetical protein